MVIESQISKDSLTQKQIKIVYWGPGEAGKTTNFNRLQQIYGKKQISKGFSIETTDERTLWNDSVHFKFIFKGFNLEVITHVATTTGQERFLSTREYILQNADGVVFVADSDASKMNENLRSFEEVETFTRRTKIPIVIQLNKRDISNAIPVESFKNQMNLPGISEDREGNKIVYEAMALNPSDNGVRDSFLSILQKIIKNLIVK